MKRLAREVNTVASDLEAAKSGLDPALGLDLVKGQDFHRVASKRVDFDGEAKLFSSLANLSVASSSCADAPLALRTVPAAKKDTVLRLEDYFTPYQGTDVTYAPHDKFSVLDLVTSRPNRKNTANRYKIQDEIDL